MKLAAGMLYHTMSARTSRLNTALRPPDAIRLLLCWAICGVAAGAALYHALPALAENPLLRQGLTVTAEPRTLWEACTAALCPHLIQLAAIWLCGGAAFGQIPALLLLFSRGLAFGLAAADCMNGLPLREGLSIAAVLLLPFGFCSILLLCHAVKDALRQAGRMTRFLLKGENPPKEAHADPLLQMLCLLLVSLIAAGLHTVLLWQLSDRLLLH